ncbi:MAG: bifunctional ornithine acetyltransferase/N-acetylglutamate synthase [Anaerolineae bacterium]
MGDAFSPPPDAPAWTSISGKPRCGTTNCNWCRMGLPLELRRRSSANALAAQPEVTVTLDVNMGSADAIVWTCDLSHDYVSINGHYRT